MENKEKQTYSFSRLTSFNDCKHSWEKAYVQKDRGVGNAFSQTGSLVHDTLEKFAKQELKLSELKDYYLDNFLKSVTFSFPSFRKDVDLKVLNVNYYARFFTHFQGVTGKIVGVEREFKYKLPDGSSFKGFIDLETETEEFYNVIDYKTGNLYPKAEMAIKKRQLLLYHGSVETKKPIRLFFYFVKAAEPKEKGKYAVPTIVEVTYTEEDLKEAVEWATFTIKEIESCKEYPYVTEGMTEKELKKNDFFCENLCNHRFSCKRPDSQRITPYGKQ